MTAQEWYEQGNAFRKESKWHEAINCYIQAIALDPVCLMISWLSIARICIIPDRIWER